MNPQPATNSPGAISTKKSRKKLFLILGTSFAALLVVGGITALIIANNIKNRPENVLAKSLYNQIFESGSPSKIKGHLNIDVADPSFPFDEVAIEYSSHFGEDKAQLDVDLSASIFTVDASLFIDGGDDSLYIKANDLQALLASGLAEEYGIPEDTRAQIQGLGNKWIEITKEDLVELSGNDSLGDRSSKCMQVIKDLVANQQFRESFKRSYNENMFIEIKNSSTDVVDGQELLKLEVGFNQSVAEGFAKQLEANSSFLLEDVTKGCQANDGADSDTGANPADDSGGEFKNAVVNIWLDKGAKQIRKISFVGDLYAEGVRSATVTTEMQIDPTDDLPQVPTDTVNIKKVLEIFQANPNQLQGIYKQPASL